MLKEENMSDELTQRELMLAKKDAERLAKQQLRESGAQVVKEKVSPEVKESVKEAENSKKKAKKSSKKTKDKDDN